MAALKGYYQSKRMNENMQRLTGPNQSKFILKHGIYVFFMGCVLGLDRRKHQTGL